MKSKPLISVIVPCYKVEKYLDECLKSITTQTYYNLEIILVDDGSPDACPQICDNWAKKDERIIVIHKQNGGLSDARNVGIAASNGDFIAFVDSDDFIESDMYERLYALYCKTNSDICACEINRFQNNSKKKIDYFQYKSKYDSKDYLSAMLSRKIDCASWNKLYTRDFATRISFRVGRNNEDFLWLFYQCYDSEITVSYTTDAYYNYRLTQGSITKRGLNEHTFDAYLNACEIKEYDKQNRCHYQKELLDYKISMAISNFWTSYKAKDKTTYNVLFKQVVHTIRTNLLKILLSSKYSIRNKIKSLHIIVYH